MATIVRTDTETQVREGAEWWRGATIYQIYPRSFADSNGDGIGDLNGITAHLDYVKALGVDAIWISPFFTSPMKDFGYDVADYCDVDPIFGTLADFDRLVAEAHGRGIRVIVDQVYSHTSDAHPWFAESRSSRTNPKADWYVWADAKPDGSPPSNWQSVFGGPAWTWDARRGQYYMHNFLKEQPQLNGHNPEVQQALLDVAQFWLDRGVDGFRVDAINFAMCDLKLTDNPPAPDNGKPRTRPFDFQLKVNNQSQPELLPFIERIRALFDRYGDRFTVAEVGGDDGPREMRLFTAGKRFNSAYGFNYLYADALTPQLVKESVEAWPAEDGIGWPSWAFSNHDAPRWISRWAEGHDMTSYARMVLLLFASLRGNIILWQGEELGLTQVDIPFELLQDPEAIANWPLTLSRDGTRTPMVWEKDSIGHGFTTSDHPWLPFGPDHGAKAVDVQEGDERSLLHLTRRLIAFRNGHDAMRHGGMDILEASDQLLVFDRKVDGGQWLRCAFNFGTDALDWRPGEGEWRLLEGVNGAEPGRLPACGGVVLERVK